MITQRAAHSRLIVQTFNLKILYYESGAVLNQDLVIIFPSVLVHHYLLSSRYPPSAPIARHPIRLQLEHNLASAGYIFLA